MNETGLKVVEPTRVIQEIQEHAETPCSETRVIDEMKVGEFFRQGDVYIVRIPTCDDWKPVKSTHLVPGATLGSRHTIEGEAVMLQSPKPLQPRELVPGVWHCPGNQIRAKERFFIRHPEHAHGSLPAGDYQVYVQVDGHSRQRVVD